MLAQYETALANRSSGAGADGIDYDLVRRVARSELKDSTTTQSGQNVFTVMRHIGQAKAELAADYAAQLARSAGKVVFFAKQHRRGWTQPRKPSRASARACASSSIRGRPDAQGAAGEHRWPS